MRRYPADRLAVIAGAARAVVIVCPGEADPASDGLALILGATPIARMSPSEAAAAAAAATNGVTPTSADPWRGGIILSSSGSTGTPKLIARAQARVLSCHQNSNPRRRGSSCARRRTCSHLTQDFNVRSHLTRVRRARSARAHISRKTSTFGLTSRECGVISQDSPASKRSSYGAAVQPESTLTCLVGPPPDSLSQRKRPPPAARRPPNADRRTPHAAHRPPRVALLLLRVVFGEASFYHRVLWNYSTFPLAPDEQCIQKSHLTTTHSLYEMFEPLLSGRTLHVLPDVGKVGRRWGVSARQRASSSSSSSFFVARRQLGSAVVRRDDRCVCLSLPFRCD